MKYFNIVYICIIIALFACVSQVQCDSDDGDHHEGLYFAPVWTGITTAILPVDMDSVDGDIYVTTIVGFIYSFNAETATSNDDVTEFFNIYASGVDFFSNIQVNGDEGLISMEFHPLYPTIPKFYAFYSSSNESVQITCWTVVDGAVDYSSADVLMTIPKPLAKHVVGYQGDVYEAYLGGDLRFNKEGNNYNLYISVGYGNDDTAAQDLNNYLGKILRIKPSVTGTGYSVPSDNPANSHGKNEIYASGVRNPRKMYFTGKSKDLFIGDVGDQFDEISRLSAAGQNFGYPIDGCNGYPTAGITYPIYTYTSSDFPHTITQGPLYKGEFESLNNRMLFADLYSGQLYSIQRTDTVTCGTGVTPVAVAEGAFVSSILVVGDDVYVSNVYGHLFYPYDQPNFYKLYSYDD